MPGTVQQQGTTLPHPSLAAALHLLLLPETLPVVHPLGTVAQCSFDYTNPRKVDKRLPKEVAKSILDAISMIFAKR